jgi:hypothetical protein
VDGWGPLALVRSRGLTVLSLVHEGEFSHSLEIGFL